MKDFNPTQEMKQAAETVFLAMAWTQTVEPVVKGYQQKILNDYVFNYALEWVERGEKEGRITNIRDTYLMTNEDFKRYMHLQNIERKKAGLHVENEEFCPLLVAESLERDAKREMVKTMECVTGITCDQLTMNLERYRKYVELTLQLLAPFVESKKALQRIA